MENAEMDNLSFVDFSGGAASLCTGSLCCGKMEGEGIGKG